MRGLGWAVVMSTLAGCGLARFDVSQDLAEQRVPGSLLGGVLPELIPNPLKLTIDVKAETEKRGTGPATHAYLKQLTLSATPHSNPSGTFDFLDEVHLYVEAPSANLPRRELATLKPVPRGATAVTFIVVPEVDLLPYLNAGAQLTASATGTQPHADMTFDGQVVVDVRI